MALAHYRLFNGATPQRREALTRALGDATRSDTVARDRTPQPPSWWKGEEHAYQQGLALIGNLGQLTQGRI